MRFFDEKARIAAINSFNAVDGNLRTQMQMSSVRLTNKDFAGSGVLVVGDGCHGIVTAKHLLCTKAGIDTPTEWKQKDVDGYVDFFLRGLQIGYMPDPPIDPQAPSMPKCYAEFSAKKDTIRFRTGACSWDYDLMFISCEQDQQLCKYLQSPRNAIYYDTSKDRKFYESFKDDAKMRNKFPIFVTGFGIMESEKAGKFCSSESRPFQVRSVAVKELPDRVLRSAKDVFVDVLVAEADNNSSTAGGDSGGPMFCVVNDRVYLLGASVGANYFEKAFIDESDTDSSEITIVNNVSTYLFRDGALF